MQTRQEATKLWENYRQNPDDEAKAALVAHYSELVRYIASTQPTPNALETSDLFSWGIIGLYDAISKFDPAREVKFETYASTRVRGAILDGIRSSDWLPRSARTNQRKYNTSHWRLYEELHRKPTEQEIFHDLEIDNSAARSMLRDTTPPTVIGLHDPIQPSDGLFVYDLLEDRGSIHDDDPEEQLPTSLAAAIAQVNDEHQQLLDWYYCEELTLSEIGSRLGVTESRVCQLHTKALQAVREQLQLSLHGVLV